MIKVRSNVLDQDITVRSSTAIVSYIKIKRVIVDTINVGQWPNITFSGAQNINIDGGIIF